MTAAATMTNDGVFKVRINAQGRRTIALPEDVKADYFARIVDRTGRITLIPVKTPKKTV